MKCRLPLSQKTRRGFSLTEIAVVLGLFSIIVGAIWTAGTTMNERSRTTDAINELQTLKTNIMTTWAGRKFRNTGTFPGESNRRIGTELMTAEMGALPPFTATTASTPWRTQLIVYVVNELQFRVSFYAIPKDACINLMLSATNCSPGKGCPMSALTDSGNNPVTVPAGGVSPADAKTACDATSNGASVEFNYKL